MHTVFQLGIAAVLLAVVSGDLLRRSPPPSAAAPLTRGSVGVRERHLPAAVADQTAAARIPSRLPPAVTVRISPGRGALIVAARSDLSLAPRTVRLRATRLAADDRNDSLSDAVETAATVSSVSLSRSPIAAVRARLQDASHENGDSSKVTNPKATPKADQEANAARLPLRRTFFLQVELKGLGLSAAPTPILGRRLAANRAAAVYWDEADLAADSSFPNSNQTAMAAEIAATLAEETLPRLADWLGEIADCDGDGVVSVLVTPWLSRLNRGQLRVDGLTRFIDLDLAGELPVSNRADLMFVNPAMAGGPRSRAVLAHEAAHLATFSRCREAGSAGPPADWLCEGLAHVCEVGVSGSDANLRERTVAFFEAPERSPLVLTNAAAAKRFRDPGCRGACHAFCDYCARRYGPRFLHAIAASGRRHGQSGRYAAGIAAVEAATGTPFADLFRDWTLATAVRRERNAAHPATVWNVCRSAEQTAALVGTAAVSFRVVGDGGWRGRVRIEWLPDDSPAIDEPRRFATEGLDSSFPIDRQLTAIEALKPEQPAQR